MNLLNLPVKKEGKVSFEIFSFFGLTSFGNIIEVFYLMVLKENNVGKVFLLIMILPVGNS